MVKKPFFLKKFGGLVLAALLLVGIFSSVVKAKSFHWDNDDVCLATAVCGNYIYVWTLDYYCSVVTTDCAYDTRPYEEVPGGKGIFIPISNQNTLKNSYLLKVKVESLIIKSFAITKKNFPVPYNAKYVSVITTYRKETTGPFAGRELESDFSNRVMWKTPKPLGFSIDIVKGEVNTD